MFDGDINWTHRDMCAGAEYCLSAMTYAMQSYYTICNKSMPCQRGGIILYYFT